MKFKSTILTAVFICLLIGISSCEDMLKVDSKVVKYHNENNLSSATDTVYSVLGIIQKMQKIADRTVLLSEVRGDLVTTTDYATTDLKNLANFDFDLNNKYNNVVDYYAVINNCNYYLAYADTSYIRAGKQVFKNEYVAVLCFRAWTYMQLGQIYGKVPFFKEPILSGDQAAVISESPKLDIKQIAKELISDFVGLEDNPTPNYSTITVGSASFDSRRFFIPVRLILGDLYLWAGDGYYEYAAKCYHDYLSSPGRRIATTTRSTMWGSYRFNQIGSNNYYFAFATGGQNNNRDDNQITYIPMETEAYDGVISDLANIFQSTADNYYYYQLTASDALKNLSKDQIYCHNYYSRDPNNDSSTRPSSVYVVDFNKYDVFWKYDAAKDSSYYFAKNKTTNDSVLLFSKDRQPDDRTICFDKNEISTELIKGDLRLYSILSIDAFSSSMSNYNTSIQTMRKIYADRICLYRNDVVYLRLAEAMNRAGMPEMAFAVLKYGLCEQVIDERISASERERAMDLGLDFGSMYFSPAVIRYVDGSNTAFAVGTANNPMNTIGLHTRGSGNSAENLMYAIPKCDTLEDSIKAVEELILDEMALETCFEGYRFGDILRVAMHRAEESKYADNAFIAEKLIKRDATLTDKFNDDQEYNPNLFLPLPQ